MINLQLWVWAFCLSTVHCALQHNTLYVDVGLFGAPWDLQYCPLDTSSPWVSQWEWPRHCPCIIWCGHHRSWWPGTILGMWCYIGKHCFSFSSAWGVWPLLPLYNMVSIFIYWSWICTLQYDWDLWPLVSIVYLEYLVILHRMAIWCFHRNSCFTRDYVM